MKNIAHILRAVLYLAIGITLGMNKVYLDAPGFWIIVVSVYGIDLASFVIGRSHE